MKTWLYPHAHEREYTRQLKQIAQQTTDTVERIITLRQDDNRAWRQAVLAALLARAEQFALPFSEQQIWATATVIAQFNNKQFHKVVSGEIGMDFYKAELWLDDVLAAWVAENVRLIKSIPQQHFDRVQQIISTAAVSGLPESQIISKIRAVKRLPHNRAELIAQDQIGKLNGQLTRQRQQSIGVKQYRWRGVLDDRERDHHVKREGKIFDWDNPPTGGHPSSEIRCRCYAQMILPELAELDALFFGNGDNRHAKTQRLKRFSTTEQS